MQGVERRFIAPQTGDLDTVLPDATLPSVRDVVVFNVAVANSVVVRALAGQSIDGAATKTVASRGSFIFISDGTNWSSVGASASSGGGFAETIGGNTSGVGAIISSGTMTLAGGNNITLSQAGNAVTISAGGGVSAGIAAISAGGAAITSGTAVFSNSNGLAFGVAGQTVTGSYTVPTVTNSSWTVSDNATSGTVARLAFTNLNGVTLSLSSGAAGSHTIVGSHNALTAVSSQSIGMNTSTAGGGTGGTSGYASGAQVRYDFYAGSNITLSQSVNAASGSLSIFGTSDTTARISALFPFQGGQSSTIQNGQSTLFVAPFEVEANFSFSAAYQWISMALSTSSNSSHGGRISVHMGIYSRNAATLSLVSSSSVAHVWTNTSNNSTASLSGLRIMSCPLAANLTPGDYYVGFLSFTGTVNANWFTASNLVATSIAVAHSGYLGAAAATSNQFYPGCGVYTTQTAAMPGSIAFSHISSAARTMPIYFVNFSS